MTFLELQNQTLRACGHTTAAASEPRTRIKLELNNWQRRLLTRPGYSRILRDSESTFSTVAGQSVYGLGVAMGRLLGIQAVVDRTVLSLRDTAWLRRVGVIATSGSAQAYIPKGWYPVQAQPTAAAPIFAKSTAAGDTTQILDWEFVLASMDRVTGQTTLTGTTAIQLGTASTVVTVVKLSMRTVATGTVTVTQTTGAGAVLVTLPIGAQFGRYLHIQLFPSPSSALLYRVDFTREITDMAQDTDQPLLPPDYHHLLALGAEYEEWRKLSDDRMAPAKQDLELEIRSLNAFIWDLPDDSQLGRVPISRLGGAFPADVWR